MLILTSKQSEVYNYILKHGWSDNMHLKLGFKLKQYLTPYTRSLVNLGLLKKQGVYKAVRKPFIIKQRTG